MSSETKKPTIEELERILANNEQADIRVAPDGSVFVSREIDRLTTENQSLRTQLAEKEAEAAEMVRLLSEISPAAFASTSNPSNWLKRRDAILEQLKGTKANE